MQSITDGSSFHIDQVIGGYQQWVMELLDDCRGYEAYFLTFMFHQMAGGRSRIRSEMEREIARTYSFLVTRVHRYPNSRVARQNPMRWFGAFDRPVPKRHKITLQASTLNDGWHVHMLALVPPFSRMRKDLKWQIIDRQAQLAHGSLYRVHVEAVDRTPGKLVQYAFKALKRGSIGFDEVLILPRSEREMPTSGSRWTLPQQAKGRMEAGGG